MEDKLINYFEKSSAHSFLINFDIDRVADELKNRGTSEFIWSKKYENLSISDARQLRSLFIEKSDKLKFFLISFFSITTEAQNALLKSLEEPAKNTKIILSTANHQSLLKTVTSRLEYIDLSKFGGSNDEVEVQNYLALSLFDKFEFHKKRFDAKSKNKMTKSELYIFLSQCEKSIQNKKTLLEIYKTKERMTYPNASLKMLMDNLAAHL